MRKRAGFSPGVLVLWAVSLGACSNSPQAQPAVHLWPGDATPEGALFWVSADIPNGAPSAIGLTGMGADLCIVHATSGVLPTPCVRSQSVLTSGTQTEALLLAEFPAGSLATVVAILDESVAVLSFGKTADAATDGAPPDAIVDAGAFDATSGVER